MYTMENDPVPDNTQPEESNSNWLSNSLNLLLISGVLMVVGCFLPWVEINALFISLSQTGIETIDGTFVLICGIIIFLAALTGKRRNRSHLSGIAFAPTLICALLSSAISIYDLTDIKNTASEITSNSENFVNASTGVGIWIAAIGSIGALWFTVSAFVARKKVKP